MRQITDRDVRMAVELLGLMTMKRVADTDVDISTAADETLFAIKPSVEGWVRTHIEIKEEER